MSQPGKRAALIIALSDYRDPKLRKLRAPATDAARLAAVLADPDIGGFEVDVALDDDERRLRRRIATFFSNRRPDDLLLVHFSCHGVKTHRASCTSPPPTPRWVIYSGRPRSRRGGSASRSTAAAPNA